MLGVDTPLWSAKVEYKLGNSPFAVFGAYRERSNLDSRPGLSEVVSDQRALGGFRVCLGDNTLRTNDTFGATLDNIEPISLLRPSLN